MANSEGKSDSSGRRPGQTKRDIEARTFRFAARIMRLVNALPATRVGDLIGRQLGRCGASIGANIEEAQGSHSRAEFIRRMNIARSEARETLYWLRLLAETACVRRERLTQIIAEAEEFGEDFGFNRETRAERGVAPAYCFRVSLFAIRHSLLSRSKQW
jgi:four helix bundle protein